MGRELRRVPLSATDARRFWSKVDKSGGPKACWPWLGRVVQIRDLRPAFDVGRIWLYAHRCAYFLKHGVWPEPQANHTCDNSLCCNPKHIYAGTQQQNVKDRDDRERRIAPSGSANGRAKLTDEDVCAIRREYQPGSVRTGATALAKKYGVHRHTIQLIGKGTTWAGR